MFWCKSASFDESFVIAFNSVRISSLTSFVFGSSESTHESSISFNFVWHSGHLSWFSFLARKKGKNFQCWVMSEVDNCTSESRHSSMRGFTNHFSMHVLQKTCSHGRMRSVFLSKQMQHSKADSSSGLTSATFVSKFGRRRACAREKFLFLNQ